MFNFTLYCMILKHYDKSIGDFEKKIADLNKDMLLIITGDTTEA